MAKQLMFSEDARKKLLSGVEQISKAVKTTLGPCGRMVMMDKKYGSPVITKDGVSVAKEIELEDPYENMGAQFVREVASKTNDDAGDGTTTATVLSYALVREGVKSVAAGMRPIEIKRGMDKAVKIAVDEIKKNAQTYDIIILDPPTFSNSKNTSNVLDINKDWPQLVKDALNILNPNGILYFSTNSERLKFNIEQIPQKTISGCQIECEDITPQTIPNDYAASKPHRCWKFSVKPNIE